MATGYAPKDDERAVSDVAHGHIEVQEAPIAVQSHCSSWFRACAGLSVPRRVYIAVCLAVFVIAYGMALQGGNLVYINEHLGTIGAEVVLSVLSLTAVTVMLYTCRMHRGTRRGTVVLMFCLFAALYVYDHGERFEEHGFYNLLVFLAIYIPLNLVLVTLYTLWCVIENFVVYLAIAVVVGGISVAVSLFHYRLIFDHGLLGSFKYVPGECTWDGRNIPLVDILPAGTQNFWAGSMHCTPNPQNILVDIDKDGVLHVQCDRPESDIRIAILPETREWPLREKDIWGTLNHKVIERTRHVRYTRDPPLVLNDTTQAVVVRCGSSSTLSLRVGPPVSKLQRLTTTAEADAGKDTGSDASADRSQVLLSAKQRRPNVIYLMLDAVSRRQFYRRLPRSARALRSLHNPGTSRISELFRLHSVGFSTDNNTKAMYLGDIYPPQPDTLPIWGHFRDQGYVTARVESGCEDWAREYNGGNYLSQDTAVSNRTLDYELIAPFCLPEYYPDQGNPFGNFKGPYSIIARCMFGRHVHEWAFDYLYKLRRELRSPEPLLSSNPGPRRPYMISATLLEGHEGTGEVLRTVDDALAAFLEDMFISEELEDTVVIVGADHGLHMGLNFAFLQNGRIEHQNPFFAMSVPEWLYQHAGEHNLTFPKGGPNPMATNEQRLVTPFEVHHTFRVLADWPQYKTEDWERSLFYPQRKGRTCAEAGIGANFCMCT
ncbi:hypothetical protein GGF46_000873 [Coemansia sp. RSA 552]|nr:hypothetical protein GGF46_000873 [Coemansia sp. RSA 552]